MKNLFSVLLIALVFVGCNKDDDNNDDTPFLVGKWKVTALLAENTYDLNNDGTATNSLIDETNCLQNETFEFKTNNLGKSFSTSYVLIDLGSGSNNEFQYYTLCVDEENDAPFGWENNDDIVTITFNGGVYDGSLSGSELTIVISDGFTIEVLDVNGSGGTTYTTEDLTYVFTKQ